MGIWLRIEEVKLTTMMMFSMKDIKHFNLLVGRNNCGKTSVLEALFLIKSDRVLAVEGKDECRFFDVFFRQ
jgi:AAA15 family ATPase/GTPase